MGHGTHVEAFEHAVEFIPAPWFALTVEFGTEGVGPKGYVFEDEAVDEVIRSVVELSEGGDEGCCASR